MIDRDVGEFEKKRKEGRKKWKSGKEERGIHGFDVPAYS